MVYLSYYEEYPIYEPAEGGYYYAGRSLVNSEKMSKRQAKREFNESFKEVEDHDEWIRAKNRYMARRESKYIGEGALLVIEKRSGSYEKGYTPYC